MGKIIHDGKIYSSSPQDVLDLETKVNTYKAEIISDINDINT